MSERAAHGAIDFGRATRTVRSRRFSARVPVRIVAVSGGLVALAVVLGVVALGVGDYPLSPTEVVRAVTGGGEPFDRTVVLEWRLPIVLAAITLGAALGIGGAIFQSLTRNPLGSPDVIGFDAGSYTAVVVAILALGARDYWTLAGAAALGGIATAVVVYLLSFRGGVQGFRLIIVGIGVSAMLGSVNSYLVTRADVGDAMVVGFWGAGSLNRVTWESMLPAAAAFVGICALSALLAPSLQRLELGDDLAMTHGTRVGAARLALIVVGVAATALVTAAAGPLGFVALVAPQLARRLTRSPGVSLLSAAAMGAALLMAAQLLTLVVAELYRTIPVGLVTVCLGGTYLIWLLVRESRRHERTS